MEFFSNNPKYVTIGAYIFLLALAGLQWLYVLHKEKKRSKIRPINFGIMSFFVIIATRVFFITELYHITFGMIGFSITVMIGILLSRKDVPIMKQIGSDIMIDYHVTYRYGKKVKPFFTWMPFLIVSLFFMTCYYLQLWL